MNPDNGCKDRNSCEGEKEVPMNTIFSYMDLQDKKNSSVFKYGITISNFSTTPGKLISNHKTQYY
jgi:uncharacterized protein affecting Mg2+/Co2+ transport